MNTYLIISLIIEILIVVIIIILSSPLLSLALLRYRHKNRKERMDRLAQEFNLSFNSNTPDFVSVRRIIWWPFDSDIENKWFKWHANQTEGVINGHKIVIYDELFRSSFFIFLRFLMMQKTFIFIDGENINKKEKFISLLTPVKQIKKLLIKLS